MVKQMTPGIRGSLLSFDALERVVPHALRGHLDESGQPQARARLRAWHLPLRSVLGPATGARATFDHLAAPLLAQLGYRVLPSVRTEAVFRALLEVSGQLAAALLVTGWGQDAAHAWREAVRHGLAHEVRWCFCVTGPVLRVFDSRRTYSRRYLEFDLDQTLDDERTFGVFWGLLRAAAMRPVGRERGTVLERAIELSEQHRALVRSSLQQGVHEALTHLIHAFTSATRPSIRGASRRHPNTSDRVRTFDESLVVIYRLLFLLFAEARGMVPHWHPVFRESYTIESLRGPVEMLPRPRGIWETLQAIARLAHRGCRIGALHVPAFNGPLFSPTHAPLADSVPLDDGAVRQAVLALTTRAASGGRERIAYGDLGVEQLGGVYERLLDFEPAPQGRAGGAALVRAEQRKATGSFYTPRSITEYVVRRTLAPLVKDASPDRILSLRVLDPAMGSGAFLVAACRYLASAYEASLVRDSGFSSTEIGERDRAEFRRAVAQQCLFGVDVNPMAVHLGRLSLWLATLAADRPLTFLDHRLRIGNSLVGASLEDLLRQPPPGNRARRPGSLPLFDDESLNASVQDAVRIRNAIATEPGDTLEQVRAKEHALASLAGDGSSLARWKEIADLWCSGWFRAGSKRLPANAFGALVDVLLGRAGSLPDRTAAALLSDATAVALRERFFHWTLEFPEVFFDASGHPLETGGFDAVIGNPPWEMLRGDRGTKELRTSSRAAASCLTEFARNSGIYRHQGAGHSNLYQLFLERALSLLSARGRLGLVLPAGFATDQGAAALRRAILERITVDSLVSFENRDGVFPIHRGLRFLLLCATAGGSTRTLPCRFGIRRPDILDTLPDAGPDEQAIELPRALLERVGGPDLAIPDLRTPQDVEIVCDIAMRIPALGDAAGWNVHFGRELNATEDRRHFVTSCDGAPVIEGKHLTPFVVNVAGAATRIPFKVAAELLDPALTFGRDRLAYRDVAAATNRLTLIAAVVPAGVLTTHTLFCLKNVLDQESQRYLCGIFNSFVANYLVRIRVTTHVSASIVGRLPVPRPAPSDNKFRDIAKLAGRLSVSPDDSAAAARLQALAATLYGLRPEQFQHVLDSFPLVPERERAAAMATFCDIVS